MKYVILPKITPSVLSVEVDPRFDTPLGYQTYDIGLPSAKYCCQFWNISHICNFISKVIFRGLGHTRLCNNLSVCKLTFASGLWPHNSFWGPGGPLK